MGSFIAAAAATGGELTIQNMPVSGALEVIERSFEKLGVSLNSEKDQVVLSARQKLRVQRDVGQRFPRSRTAHGRPFRPT